ncbi:LutC/YkgG family protein [Desulfogranum japonicum]|uniref:LutC/YkgG family protein n=1 Tax=Desulfogranum japonicum TaxID=231447 RepID=UPI0003FE288F|nr:lactate utilization protein [Desulfogranum japonicum]
MQQTFISTIKQALGRSQGSKPAEDLFTTEPSEHEKIVLTQIQQRTSAQHNANMSRLREVTGPLYVNLHEHSSLEETAEAIAALIKEKSPEWGTEKHVCRWDHPLINQLKLESLPELSGIPIHTTPIFDVTDQARPIPSSQKEQFRAQVEQSFIGITSADYCVAATATLALRSRPGQSRSVSLVPSIHVAVVKEKKLLSTLEELYTLLKWDPAERKEGLTNNLSLISGPSKTGDIELIMVHGAHGPRELHLFIIGEEQ